MDWIMDMSIECHKCCNVNQLLKCKIYEKNGEKLLRGYIPWVNPNNVVVMVPIKDVKLAPEESYNGISLAVIIKNGFKVQYRKDVCEIYRNEEMVLEGRKSQYGYKVETEKGEEVILEVHERSENLDCIKEEPRDWKNVLQQSQEEQKLWNKAMDEEIQCLKNNQVLENCEPKPQDRVIGSKWVYSVKYDEEGRVSRIRARLVALGCHQKEGVDFGETYAPVVSQTTIRTLLTMVANQELYIRHCDIASAFLNGELDEIIFMREPRGMEEQPKVYRLKKAIYGLKQAAHCWNEKINKSLVNLGYLKCSIDPCLYKKQVEDKGQSFVLIHVDDLLMVSKYPEEINDCIEQLSKEYKVKDLGEARKYLGIYLERDREKRNIQIHQKPMITMLLQEYGLKNSRPVHTPMAQDHNKSQFHIESPNLPNNVKYQQAIGSLLYLGLMTRPDIHLAVNILSRKTAMPTQWDWESVKRVLRYLETTIDGKLTLGGLAPLILYTYCDADWGGDEATRRSTSGQMHFLGNSIIEWKARRQNCVSLSTAEAEFIAAAEALQSLCWIRTLLKELSIPEKLPFLVHTDNQSCIKMCQTHKQTKKTKHVDIKYHFIKEMIELKVIQMEYCPMDNMLADLMTKPLGRSQHWRLNVEMGMMLE